MTKFCCEDLVWACEKYVKYSDIERSFSIYEKGSSKYGLYIDCCPFCGEKLPKHLVDELWNTILEELGPDYLVDDDGNPPKKELPSEFQSDEWWIKRGL